MTRTLKDIQQHTLVRIVDDNEDLRETCEMMLHLCRLAGSHLCWCVVFPYG